MPGLVSHTPIRRLRIIGFIEGVSYLVLLFIAMPMKYLADMPLAVTYTGWVHGLLFILYVAALAHVMLVHRWSLWQGTRGFVAALVPFGTFVLDREWREQELELAAEPAA
jgi:integral membrane protein